VHGEDHSLTGPHGVDDLARLIAKLAHADLHVRHSSTGNPSVGSQADSGADAGAVGPQRVGT
jgi:hypothetical protein